MVRIAAGALALAATLGVGPGPPTPPAHAHSAPSGWQYPIECCGGHDCYEIDASEIVAAPGSWRILATGEFFSASRVKRSPDGHYHRCSYEGDPKRTTNCLFVPGPSS
jgi:hypothetical protein